jgi:hypothetical protein
LKEEQEEKEKNEWDWMGREEKGERRWEKRRTGRKGSIVEGSSDAWQAAKKSARTERQF